MSLLFFQCNFLAIHKQLCSDVVIYLKIIKRFTSIFTVTMKIKQSSEADKETFLSDLKDGSKYSLSRQSILAVSFKIYNILAWLTCNTQVLFTNNIRVSQIMMEYLLMVSYFCA